MNLLEMKIKTYISIVATALIGLTLLLSCEKQDNPEGGDLSVPEGMVAVRPVLPGTFEAVPRDASTLRSTATRAYDPDEQTNSKLNKTVRLPEGSTLWLIAKNQADASYEKKSYVVYNSYDDENRSYLMPCTVTDDGELINMESTPMYLKDGTTYLFSAVSPARKLDDKQLAQGKIGFKVRNGEYFYANDCRYKKTTPKEIKISNNNTEAIHEVTLSPMINQTAELKFQIMKGKGVHTLDIQPSGIEISGLQNDSTVGISWHMSQNETDQPLNLQHNNRSGIYNQYNYFFDDSANINIEVPILPMYSTSIPVIVLFRLKVNGVPTTYQMMLNEKDFKAGYSYGYLGKVTIKDGVDVITWQYIAWEIDVEFPFN